jgi:hypothetical protein
MNGKVTTAIIGLFFSFGAGPSAIYGQDIVRFSDKHNIYLRNGISTGTYSVGYKLDLNYVYDNKYSLQTGYSGFFQQAENEPDDYSIGVLELFTFGLTRAYDQVHNYNLLAGRVFVLNEKETLRFHVRGGAAYSRRLIPENWSEDLTFGLAQNYSYDYREKRSAAAVVNLELE